MNDGSAVATSLSSDSHEHSTEKMAQRWGLVMTARPSRDRGVFAVPPPMWPETGCASVPPSTSSPANAMRMNLRRAGVG